MKSLAFLDLETTGTDPAKDRIVEIAVLYLSSGLQQDLVWRVNPGIPIPQSATAVHGISDADVAKCPTFKNVSNRVAEAVSACDLAGYNLSNYDIPLLWEEFDRAGITWDLTGINIIDVKNIFFKKEQRTLEAAVQFYCGEKHEEAHGAMADAQATAKVLRAQLKRYTDLGEMDMAKLAAFCCMEEQPRIDLASKLVRDADGDAVYNFGPKKGTKLRIDPGFAAWMLGKDFSKNTKLHVQMELQKLSIRR